MSPHELVMAEVDELVSNQARLCSLCRRRARFWPPRPETLVRAPGRGWSDRCQACVLAPDVVWAALHNTLPTAQSRRSTRHHQAEQVVLQIEEIEHLPPSAECEQALTMLYLQLQLLADEMFNEELGLRVIPGGKTSATWSPVEQLLQ